MNKKIIKVTKSRKILEVLTDAGFSYSVANKILRNKDIKLNGDRIKENVRAQVGDEVAIFYKDEINNFKTVYEDDEVLIINKFSNVEVDEDLARELNVYLVHRLDRNTEGLLMLAKTIEAKNKLDKAIKNHKIKKFYLTEVVGKFDVDKTFVAYLKKDDEKSLVKVYKNKIEDSVKIETAVRTLKAGDSSSLLEVEIIGGKTHQIRAHLSFLGHAIIGDGKYAKREDYKRFDAKKQKLFAYKLVFGNVGLNIDGKEVKAYPSWIEQDKLNKILKG